MQHINRIFSPCLALIGVSLYRGNGEGSNTCEFRGIFFHTHEDLL